MNIEKLRIPLVSALSAFVVVAGSVWSAARASTKLENVEERVGAVEKRTEATDRRAEEDRLDVRELKTLMRTTAEAVRGIAQDVKDLKRR
jgi:septal ring factor EnvC (AmiA/AmiB activator)